MNDKALKIALGAGAALLAATLLLFRRSDLAAPPPTTEMTAPAREATPVQTVLVIPQAIDESVAAVGTVRADESVDIQAEISGKLVKIQFTEGAVAHAGDLLAVINDAELRAAHKRAVYRRDLSGLKVRRIASLIEKGGVPQQEYDIAASELQVLGAEVDVIEAQLARTEIRAPFDGIIGLRTVSEGASVTPSTRIATFQRLDRLKVDFSVPEKYANRIDPAGEVSVTLAGADRPLTGKIHAIEPSVDPVTRTVLVRAVCPNPSGRMFSGGFARVQLLLARIPDAILVPALAIVPGATDHSVFVIENGQARRRAVRLGVRTDSAVQVVEGIRAGDLVITSGLQQVRPGLAVRALRSDLRPGAGPPDGPSAHTAALH